MEQYLFGRKDVHYTYDFRGKRVKVQRGGDKPKVVDKFSLGYDIGSISFYKGLYAADIYNYAECAQLLLELLEDKKFNNVTIIK